MMPTSASPSLQDATMLSRAPQPDIDMHDRFLEALTAREMGPRLGAALSGSAAWHVLDAKYEPGVYARIVYEHGGRLVRGDLAADEQDGTLRPDDGAPVVPPGVRIWRFPDDPDLVTLPSALQPAVLGSIVRRAEARNASSVARDRIDLLRYRPGKRATFMITLGSGGGRHVAKVYHRSDKAAAVAAEATALGASATPSRRLRLAPLVAYSPDLAIVIHRAVEGIPLEALVGARRVSIGRAGRGVIAAARALAEFHALPVVTVRQRSTEKELVRFGERAARIIPFRPMLGVAASSLARRLAKTQLMLRSAPIGPVHGDCKPSAFLVHDDGVPAALLDLDHHGISDQTGDVGTFLASLRQLAVRRRLAGRPLPSNTALADLSTLFLDAYVEAVGRDDLRPRIRWQEAAALERKALRAFSRAPLSPLPMALVQAGDRCLDQLGSGR
jgi:aminoglycoside phosphotransferase (APT) family kinase protein